MADIEVIPLALHTQVTVQSWPGTAAAVSAALDAPPVGHFADRSGGTIATLAPGRWLVLAESEGWQDSTLAAFDAETASVTRLDHGRAGFRLAGQRTREVLMQALAIDLDPAVMPSGRAFVSQIHDIGVTVMVRDADTFDVLVYASHAHAFEHWLHDAMKSASQCIPN